MTAPDGAYAQWLSQAQIAEERLTPEQRGLLQAAFAFRRRCGDDYYSNRLLSHFLLHCDAGLKVAQIARLVGISRPTASHQQGVSSKEAIQAAHHRLAGRPYVTLLNLQDRAVPLLRQVLREGRPRTLHALFAAGADKSDAGVRALWDLAEQHANLEVTLRAFRYPHRMRLWKQLPSGLFVSVLEPGVCVGAPPKEVRLAETQTVLKGESPEQAIRTIVCREIRPGPKKDRWHPLYTTSAGFPEDILPLFRTRQYHEQAHRVEVHDLFVDAVPCGYDKDSPDRKRPRFQRGPWPMIGWLVALLYKAVADLGEALGEAHSGDHLRTLRRKFFNRPGQLYETPKALIVYLDPFAGQDELVPVIDALNAGHHRLPWLDNRRLVMSLTPTAQGRRGP
jgi:hypothetical protein